MAHSLRGIKTDCPTKGGRSECDTFSRIGSLHVRNSDGDALDMRSIAAKLNKDIEALATYIQALQ